MPASPSSETAARDLAKLVLDRAHLAARDANGADLRRALQEARDLLQPFMADAASRLTKALVDLETGALVELEALLEGVRREL